MNLTVFKVKISNVRGQVNLDVQEPLIPKFFISDHGFRTSQYSPHESGNKIHRQKHVFNNFHLHFVEDHFCYVPPVLFLAVAKETCRTVIHLNKDDFQLHVSIHSPS